LGDILLRADHYNPMTLDIELLEDQYDVYQKVWKDAERLRSSGMLLELGKNIQCPVIAIHGDYDPHPVEGVERPLTPILKDFRLFLLKNCGHLPWIEREAVGEFYRILKDELR
jgi:pimeloyl-ACP methyl ester carboxylesterase